MRVIFKNKLNKPPLVSILLGDWSVRQSAHTLDYLNAQDVDRGLYEIIWIEYFNREWEVLKKKLEKSLAENKPILDQWIVLDSPRDYNCHRHRLINMGIYFASGKIFVACDSDAMLRPIFISSIISEFNKDDNIVLHMDQIRSLDKRFFPFNYPSFEEVINSNCLNAVEGKPEGLIHNLDRVKNYAACICINRQDAIMAGGIDEHIDYLGYICGAEELTFRLMNRRKKIVWCSKEWLYHTWHPGTGGNDERAGPQDGLGASAIALECLSSGRITPLVENNFIRSLRLGEKEPETLHFPEEWKKGGFSTPLEHADNFKKIKLKPRIRLFIALGIIYAKFFTKRTYGKVTENRNFGTYLFSIKDLLQKINFAVGIFKRRWDYFFYVAQISYLRLGYLKSRDFHEIVVFGHEDADGLLKALCSHFSLKIKDFYGDINAECDHNRYLQCGVVIVCYWEFEINDVARQIKNFLDKGVSRQNIIVII